MSWIRYARAGQKIVCVKGGGECWRTGTPGPLVEGRIYTIRRLMPALGIVFVITHENPEWIHHWVLFRPAFDVGPAVEALKRLGRVAPATREDVPG